MQIKCCLSPASVAEKQACSDGRGDQTLWESSFLPGFFPVMRQRQGHQAEEPCPSMK